MISCAQPLGLANTYQATHLCLLQLLHILTKHIYIYIYIYMFVMPVKHAQVAASVEFK